MRPNYILLLALTLLLACANAVFADPTAHSVSVFGGEASEKRLLRTPNTDDDDDEERLNIMDKFKLWNINKKVNKGKKNMDKATAKAAKEAEKLAKAAKKASDDAIQKQVKIDEIFAKALSFNLPPKEFAKAFGIKNLETASNHKYYEIAKNYAKAYADK